ncbi:MAG: quinone oxidoreductase family protein, partial [Rubrobacteraceae bacterium]
VLTFGGRPGFYAEYVAVPQDHVVRMPENLDWDTAAALPVAPLSAWYCLRHLAQLRSGEKVLIWAAASGVDDAAVQIAKHLGATVIATAGSDEKVAWALENGADEGINHATEEVLARTRDITGEDGVEVVLDTVGGAGLRRESQSGRSWRARSVSGECCAGGESNRHSRFLPEERNHPRVSDH